MGELLLGIAIGGIVGAVGATFMTLQICRIRIDGLLRECERLRRMAWAARQTDAAVLEMRRDQKRMTKKG